MTSEKILEVENMLQALSEELLKLKSTSEHYEETKENLQKMCESIDKISLTHQKLTDNIGQVLARARAVTLYMLLSMIKWRSLPRNPSFFYSL